MSQVRFLFDENIDPDLIDAMLRREPTVDVLRSGWDGAPAVGAKDPEVLQAAETLGRLLVSRDRHSFPGHLTAHFAAGRHTQGVALLLDGHSFKELIDELLLIWSCSEAEDWKDVTVYLPL